MIIYSCLMQHVRTAPNDFYVMAGHHDLQDLTIAVLQFMLHYPLAIHTSLPACEPAGRDGQAHDIILPQEAILSAPRTRGCTEVPAPLGHPAMLDCDFPHCRLLNVISPGHRKSLPFY